MRLLILRDKSLDTDEFNEAVTQLKDLYTQAGVKSVLITQEEYYWGDPKEAPRKDMWEPYWGGYWGMKQALLTGIVKEIDTRYGKKFDHILIAMDDRNWYGDIPENKVWGWNISAGILGYDVQQCRVDTVSRRKETRIANTLGVMYHELMHSHKHFPYRVFYGATIERNMRTRDYNIQDWSEEVVHGTHPDWEYIRHKDNVEALKVIAPVLNAAYETKEIQDRTGKTVWDAVMEAYRTQVIKSTEPFAEQ